MFSLNPDYATGWVFNANKKTVLVPLLARSKITIQTQLEKFEYGGLLMSNKVGRTRVYEFNPRYPLLREFLQLLKRALEFLPAEEQQRLLVTRERPRRKGKPL